MALAAKSGLLMSFLAEGVINAPPLFQKAQLDIAQPAISAGYCIP